MLIAAAKTSARSKLPADCGAQRRGLLGQVCDDAGGFIQDRVSIGLFVAKHKVAPLDLTGDYKCRTLKDCRKLRTVGEGGRRRLARPVAQLPDVVCGRHLLPVVLGSRPGPPSASLLRSFPKLGTQAAAAMVRDEAVTGFQFAKHARTT
eukprot:scaffold1446_cov391-Prasinococcus_capsulatus_cf.AAC.24